MRIVLQRVSSAHIVIDGETHREIGKGLLLLVGVQDTDDGSDVETLARKCAQMRIFTDDEGKMNLSAQDLGLDAMVVSNFTLYADTKKGKRPSFIRAARPEQANEIYEKFLAEMKKQGLNKVESGEFGAHMDITPVCDGPVTIILDPADWTKEK